MRIDFYLKEDETNITTFFDMVSNPFSVGEVINLNVSELFPKDYKSYPQQLKEKMISDNKELISLFKRKKVKLISEGKYVYINKLRESSLVIEYHCEFVS